VEKSILSQEKAIEFFIQYLDCSQEKLF
jgi:hypothetical protein